jgi:hypothetical protein
MAMKRGSGRWNGEGAAASVSVAVAVEGADEAAS